MGAPDDPRAKLVKTSEEPLYRGLLDGNHEVFVDEGTKAPPIGSGEDRYPTPIDTLCWSLASCQAAVLTQCLAKARIDDFRIEVVVDIEKEEHGSVPDAMPAGTARRIQHLDVSVDLEVPDEFESSAKRCLDVYDRGCIVGQSLKAGVDYDPDTTFTTY